MTAFDFSTLRSGGPTCPSDLSLDALVGGDPVDGAIRVHVDACPLCRRRVDERRAGFAAFPEVNVKALRAAIEGRSRSRPRRRWAVAGGGLVAAAMGVLLLLRPSPQADLEVTRVKGAGAPVLHVHRFRGDGTEEVSSGQRFAPGDRLRFVVDLPAPGHVTILGVEASGRGYRAWPLDGSTAVAMGAGTGQALPGAVALDGRSGREVLSLVQCPTAADAEACRPGGTCPARCARTDFVLDKGP